MNRKFKNISNIFTLGIGQKIYAAMAVLILLALVMAATTLSLISSISNKTENLATNSLPQIMKSSIIAQKNNHLSSTIEALVHAESNEELENLRKTEKKVLEELNELINTINLNDEEKEELISGLNEAHTIIPDLVQTTKSRLSLTNELQAHLSTIKSLHEALIRLASPLYDDAEFNLMIALGDLSDVGTVIKQDDAKKIRTYGASGPSPEVKIESLPSVDMSSISSELDANMASLQNSLKYVAEINSLSGYYATAELVTDKEFIIPLKELYTAVSGRIDSLITNIESEELQEKTKEYLSFGKGEKNVFSLREQYLIELEKAHSLTKRLDEILENLANNIKSKLTTIELSAKHDAEIAVKSAASIESTTIVMTVMLILVALATGLFYVRPFIVNRLIAVYKATEEIANGNLELDIKKNGHDELAKMAEALILFRDNAKERIILEQQQSATEERQRQERKEVMVSLADQFEIQIGKIVSTVANAAEQIQERALNLSHTIAEASSTSDVVAGSSLQASENVQAVAAASEQLSASIQEISSNVIETATTAKECASFAQESQNKLDQLRIAVEEIDAVIQSINDVAEQTNLLALNATIEAARAGEAGKGFAVVANEVKALASQTHNMTDEISNKVEHIKNSAAGTIESMHGILVQITAVDEKTASVASAVEEQNASTAEISRNVQRAADGTDSVSNNIKDIQSASNESAKATEQLKTASDELADQTSALKEAVNSFISNIRQND